MKHIITAILGASAILIIPVNAAVIAQYNFDGSTLASSDLDTSTTATLIESGIPPSTIVIGADGSSSGSRTSAAGLAVFSEHTDTSTGANAAFAASVSGFALVGQQLADLGTGGDVTLATAFGNNHYITFDVVLNGASQIDLTSFTFNAHVSGGSANQSFWLLAGDTGSTFTTANLIGTGTPAAWSSSTGEKSISSFTTSTFTADTEFRLYLATNLSGTSKHGFALDNITLNGDVVAIPEPSAALLGGLGMLLLLRRRR